MERQTKSLIKVSTSAAGRPECDLSLECHCRPQADTHTSCWHKNKRNPPGDDYFTFLAIVCWSWPAGGTSQRTFRPLAQSTRSTRLECQRINAVNRPALGWAELKSISLFLQLRTDYSTLFSMNFFLFNLTVSNLIGFDLIN